MDVGQDAEMCDVLIRKSDMDDEETRNKITKDREE